MKESLKKAAQNGGKLVGKTLVKNILDPKMWLIAYMAIVTTKAYNKLGDALNREGEINREAARKIEERIATLEGMNAICDEYNLTPEQVREVIKMQKEISNTQKAVIKTAADQKKSWRDWLPGAKKLTEKGARDGLGVENGQLNLALDSYDEAEKDLNKKEQLKAKRMKSYKDR